MPGRCAKEADTLVNIYEPAPVEGVLEQWPVLSTSGALEVRLAETEAEVGAAQQLRYRVFYEEMSAVPSPQMRAEGRDFDRFDEICDHLLVVDREVLDNEGQPSVVGTYRFMRNEQAQKAGGFYTAGEFEIGPMFDALPDGTRAMELGRSCILKAYRSKPATMQLLWRGVMRYAARFSIDLMFGCASLQGTDPDALALPLSYLHHFHGMPEAIRVRALPELRVDMNRMPKDQIAFKDALRALPPMIKGYVRAGCMIGDGAVIDPQFGTTDVLIYFPLADMDPRYKSRFGAAS
jgi:putative hemolysin